MSPASKESLLESYGATKVEPMELYTDLFRLGEGLIQRKLEKGEHKSNPIILGSRNDKRTRRILFEDTFEKTLNSFHDYDWAFTNGITYWGRANKSEAQGAAYGLIFDLDGVGPTELENLLSGALNSPWYPIPNYIALSGYGLHLYYVLAEPLQLFPNTKLQLKNLKYALTDLIWNGYTSSNKEKQFQGINQGFRAIGTATKIKGRYVEAYRLKSERSSLEYLNSFVPEGSRLDEKSIWKESRYTLSEAKMKFPQWYEKVVEQGIACTGRWTPNKALYEWWLNRVKNEAAYGHRYFCIMCMAIFAKKCDISRQKLESDAEQLREPLTNLSPSNPLTSADIRSALECYDERYVTFPRRDIERLSGIAIPPNKRNGRTRAWHLELVNMTNAAKRKVDGIQIGGKASKREEVESYYQRNPDASVRKAASDLGISKTTVQKWRPRTVS